MNREGLSVVEDYLEALVTQDWDTLRACLREDVVRNGPFRDEYRGRDAYVAFLAELMPTLPGYAMDVRRVGYVRDGRLAVAQLTETITVSGGSMRTEESLLFELDEDGLIARIDIYIKTNRP